MAEQVNVPAAEYPLCLGGEFRMMVSAQAVALASGEAVV